jgi:CelD/BcsL family acetyltransferase involved in cellulose biosynthesis
VNLSVEAVCDRERLHALENEWRSLHSADEHSHVFTSWPWMSGRLAGLSTPWWVLVARAAADGPVIGLLALRQLPAPGAAQSLAMAGSPLADYTGFVCDSQFEQEVLTALAIYVQQRMVWQLLEIHDARDPRLRGFLAHFGAPRYRIERIEPTPCPYLELDDSWEDYLRARSTRMRKKIRRELRMMEALAGVRRTTLSDDAERQIEILLQLWQMRWGALPATRLAEYSAVFRACAAAGCLWLDVLWQGSAPIVALLAFLDRPQGSFCYYISGFDSRYAALSPGSVMVAHSIRAAIQGGYRGYDFLRGDEHYKLSFGARIRASDNVAVIKQGRSAATELDSVL